MNEDAGSTASTQTAEDVSRPEPTMLAPGVEALSQAEKTDADRTAILAGELHDQVASGARVESQGHFQAVVVRGRRANHLLHFLISLVTLGIWSPVWIVITAVGGEKRTTIDVDRFGNTFVRRA